MLKDIPVKVRVTNKLKQIEDDIQGQLDKFFDCPVNKDILNNRRSSLSELLDELISKHAPGKTR